MPETQPNSVPNPVPQLQTLGLAKSAPVAVVAPPEVAIAPPPKPMEALSTPSFEGIPVDTIRYFGLDLAGMDSKQIEQLKDIDTWAKRNLLEDTIGGRLQKIRTLESRLGAPSYHETRLTKMWNWVKMDFNINELRNRQAAFEYNGGMKDILR